MYKHFSFKGPNSFTDFWCFIFQFGGLGADGTKFCAPVTAWALQLGGMECGWYRSDCACNIHM